MGFYRISRLLSLILVMLFCSAAIVYAADNAQFVNQSIPSQMITSQKYVVSVTMKNTGDTTWTKAGAYRLGSQNPQDNWKWGIGRVDLAASESIAPGNSKTFTFTVTSPKAAGTYNFQWKMLQEKVRWFGGLSTNIAVRVMLPNGWGCSNNSQCNSSFCNDKVCCNSRQCGIPPSTCVRSGDTSPDNSRICKGQWKTLLNHAGCNVFPCDRGTCVNNVCVSDSAATFPDGWRCANNSQCQSGFCSNTVCCSTGQCGWGDENGTPASCVYNGGTKQNKWASAVCRNGQWRTVLNGIGCNIFPCDRGICADNICFSTFPCSSGQCVWGDGITVPYHCVPDGGTKVNQWLSAVCRNGTWKGQLGGRGCSKFNVSCDQGTCISDFCLALSTCDKCRDSTACNRRNSKGQRCDCTDVNRDGKSEVCELFATSECMECSDGTACGQKNARNQTCQCLRTDSDTIYENCTLITLPPGKRADGDRCTQTTQCASGVCIDGICGLKPDRQKCASNNQCTSKRCINGYCGPQPNGWGCKDDSECISKKCVQGHCGLLRDLDRCNNKNECYSGICTYGYCGLYPNTWGCPNNNKNLCASKNCNNDVCCSTGQCGWGDGSTTYPRQCVSNGGTKQNKWLSGICRSGQWKTVLKGWGCSNSKWPCDQGTCINNLCLASGNATLPTCDKCRDSTACNSQNTKGQKCDCTDVNRDGKSEVCELFAASECVECNDGTTCSRKNARNQTCQCKKGDSDLVYENCILITLPAGKKADGDKCTRDTECNSGKCITGICGLKGDRQNCTSNDQCTSKRCINWRCGLQPDGWGCKDGSECISKRCVQGRCGLLRDLSRCSNKNECYSGICIDGYCGLKPNWWGCGTNSSVCASKNCNNDVCCSTGQCGWGDGSTTYPRQCVSNGGTKQNKWLSGICRSGQWKTVLKGWGCSNSKWPCDQGTCVNNFCVPTAAT